MALRVVEAREDLLPAVVAMNKRLKAGGSRWGFYDRLDSGWLAPRGPDDPLCRRHWLLEETMGGTVHGGYVLKVQPALLDGAEVVLGNVQGPVSEGLVNRRHALAGPLMLKDSLRRVPLQIAWGTSERKVAMLVRAGWSHAAAPLLVAVTNGAALARAAAGVRRGMAARGLAFAASTGLADLAGLAQRGTARILAGLGAAPAGVRAWVGAWDARADHLWEAASASGLARLAAVRDRSACARLMPDAGWPHARPWWVEDGAGKTLGWVAVVRQRLDGDRRLGDAQVATLADALALPGAEAAVAQAVVRAVAADGAALVVGAFTHERWVRAFRSAGLWSLAGRRALLLSPALAARLGPAPAALPGLHLALIDGDGPRIFAAPKVQPAR